jgi:AcrR family transcriptional regulator
LETKDKIINAAKRLFAKYGFITVSTRDIAEEAGTALSAVHYHFESKDKLLFALVKQFTEEQTAVALVTLTTPKSAADFELRLTVFTDTLIQSLLKDLPLYKIIHNEMYRENPILQKVKTETIMSWFTKIVTYFEDSKKLGFLDVSCSSQMAATVFVREITHTVKDDEWNSKHYRRTLRDKEQREQFIDDLISLVLKGILKR